MSFQHVSPPGTGASSISSSGVQAPRIQNPVQQVAVDCFSAPTGGALEAAWMGRAVSVACDPYPRINEIYAVKRQDPVGKLAQQIEKLKEEIQGYSASEARRLDVQKADLETLLNALLDLQEDFVEYVDILRRLKLTRTDAFLEAGLIVDSGWLPSLGNNAAMLVHQLWSPSPFIPGAVADRVQSIATRLRESMRYRLEYQLLWMFLEEEKLEAMDERYRLWKFLERMFMRPLNGITAQNMVRLASTEEGTTVLRLGFGAVVREGLCVLRGDGSSAESLLADLGMSRIRAFQDIMPSDLVKVVIEASRLHEYTGLKIDAMATALCPPELIAATAAQGLRPCQSPAVVESLFCRLGIFEDLAVPMLQREIVSITDALESLRSMLLEEQGKSEEMPPLPILMLQAVVLKHTLPLLREKLENR